MMTPLTTRRDLLKATSCGFGYLALAGLANEASAANGYQSPLAPRPTHFGARAKRVIFMFMQGGPTHLDTFDYKPELAANDGKTVSSALLGGKREVRLLGPQYEFSPQGSSGLMMSSLFPHLAKHADDLCLINGMFTDSPAHPQASVMLQTGSTNFVRPSLGSWVIYGLGTSNQDLPGFVTINPPGGAGGAQNYGSAFLPAAYQGTRLATGGDAIQNIRNKMLGKGAQRHQLDLVQNLNRGLLDQVGQHNELEGVIESYELAFRMQSAVPAVVDLDREAEGVKERYGIGEKATDNFGKQCLMARRLAEKGVRFIQISTGGWDQHKGIHTRLKTNCQGIDQPIAGLMSDLKERGMLEDTLLVWGGEFGRAPREQAPGQDGRPHNNRGYTMWMAGGGVKGGQRYGATDPLGGVAVQDKVHIHDLHATILHLLGMNHEQLTYRYAGRDFRLTDVHGDVVKGILA
ncbi:DUF1501 domain-containing protein [Verrucomicrobiales bacterium]|nr:DUF1501 domain-containing protein [Verrucomicrobiales bacterium]